MSSPRSFKRRQGEREEDIFGKRGVYKREEFTPRLIGGHGAGAAAGLTGCTAPEGSQVIAALNEARSPFVMGKAQNCSGMLPEVVYV